MKLKKRWLMVLLAIITLSLGLTGGCAGYQEAGPGEQAITTVSPSMAYALIQENEGNPDFVILDVRTPEEYAEGYLDGAILLDFYAADFEDELDKLDKNKRYVVYCRSGNRSGQSVDIMEDLDFMEVYDVDGGILRWEAEGFPTAK
jgi:rhodanese-related sulfurtransferase